MKRVIVMCLVLLMAMIVRADVITTDIRFDTVQPADTLVRTLRTAFAQVNSDIDEASINTGTGDVFYVDSGVGSDTYTGADWDHPFATLDAAINACTANNGDYIFVAAGHSETITASGGVDLDCAGVTVVGLGNGDLRPTFTFTTDTAADVDIDAADITVSRLRFLCGIDSQAAMITVSGDDFTCMNCFFGEGGGDGDMNGVSAVVIGETDDNTADRCLIMGCEFYLPTTTNWVSAINFAKDMANVMLLNNIITGDFSEAGINIPTAGNAQKNVCICGNIVTNTESDDHALQANGTGNTGTAYGNAWITNGTYVDAGGIVLAGNLSKSIGDSDTDAWTWDLAANNLDHLMKTAVASGTDLTTEVVDGTVLSNILTIAGDTSDYARATMSLEYIAGEIDTIEAVTTDLAGISDIGDKVVADMDANSTQLAAIVAVTDDLAGISQIGDKVQADMDANSLLYWQERTVAVSVDEVTADIADVAGGPILIKNIVGIVTAEIGGNATNCKLLVDRDDSAADTEFTTAVAIQSDAVGTVYVFTAANPSVLTPLTPGANGSSSLMTGGWFCPEGMIEQNMSADPGGAAGDHITWYITYVPLAAGVTVTAQ